MKTKGINTAFALCAASLLTVAVCSCKGRTTDNVVPNGETAEVLLDTTEIVVSLDTDSVAADEPAADNSGWQTTTAVSVE